MDRALRLLLLFLLPYTLFILYCKLCFTRDPTSYFFDRNRAYKPIYSVRREQQALDFIETSSEPTAASLPHSDDSPANDSTPSYPKTMCVGVLTIQRQGKQHFPAAIGSLLEGLTPSERASIHLVTLFSDLTPEDHSSYHAPWLPRLTDQILVRPAHLTNFAAKLAEAREKSQKATLDYHYLLEACHNAKTPFATIIEDDIIASRSWYRRALAAARELELRHRGRWLYLRLFYTETLLGHNLEDGAIPKTSAAIVVLTLAALLLSKLASRKYRALPDVSPRMMAVTMCVYIPLMLAAYFLAGRLSMQPLPRGLIRMDEYGCCSQGLVFPREYVALILANLDLEVNGHLFPDQRIENLADSAGLSKWALVPCVFQHVGRNGADGTPKRTWNFQFEVTDHERG